MQIYQPRVHKKQKRTNLNTRHKYTFDNDRYQSDIYVETQDGKTTALFNGESVTEEEILKLLECIKEHKKQALEIAKNLNK